MQLSGMPHVTLLYQGGPGGRACSSHPLWPGSEEHRLLVVCSVSLKEFTFRSAMWYDTLKNVYRTLGLFPATQHSHMEFATNRPSPIHSIQSEQCMLFTLVTAKRLLCLQTLNTLRTVPPTQWSEPAAGWQELCFLQSMQDEFEQVLWTWIQLLHR